MTTVKFYTPAEIDSLLMKYAVIAARYKGQWIFSRHKERSTWEIPGGRRELGESIEETARRELWEETGAKQAELMPICVYSVTKNGDTTYGMLYFAEVTLLEAVPAESEIEEILISANIPEVLTYPDIQPALFWKIQGWLNTQCSAEELWDLYEENRELAGKVHRRGEPLPEGKFHLVVHVWMMNKDNKFLLTKRSAVKGFPNMWESTGGSALAGEDSLTAALREVQEETGLKLDATRGKMVLSVREKDCFRDIWLFRQDCDLLDVVLKPDETVDKMYASKECVLRMYHTGELVPYTYLKELFALI